MNTMRTIWWIREEVERENQSKLKQVSGNRPEVRLLFRRLPPSFSARRERERERSGLGFTVGRYERDRPLMSVIGHPSTIFT